MDMGRGLVHVQHRIEYPQMGVALLERLRKLLQHRSGPITVQRAAAAIVLVADLEDDLMEQLLLFALADMLIVIGYLVPGLFLLGVVCSQGFIEYLMIDLFQILLAEGDVQPRPAPVDIGRRERPIVVPNTSPARHAGDRDTHEDHPPFFPLNVSDILAATLPTASMLPYPAGRCNLFVTFSVRK